MQSIFYMEIYKIMIVKIISPEDEQAYMLDNDIDIRHMLIEYANSYDGKEDLQKYLNYMFEKFTKCNSDFSHYRIFAGADVCVLINETEKKVYNIHFHETKGNCVDKFTQHILSNDISTINYLFLYIKDRERLRSIENEYHSSVLFEQDFSDMTHIKETAQSIIDKINKFQEQITLADYTKL